MRRLFLAVAALAALTAAPAQAQTPAQSADEQAIRAIVKQLFDGMRTRDTTMMKGVFADEARFYGVNAQGAVRVTLPAQFISGIAAAPAGVVLDEVLHEFEVRIDGPLATVWTYYDFFAGERFSHCGFDAFQMLKTAAGWKIVALADSRRMEGCKQKRSRT
jgi:hypothetical protein